MRVTPIAHTLIDWNAVKAVIPGTRFAEEAYAEYDQVSDLDHLAEFAGRACYKAWERKRAETATTAGYLNNITTQGHFSVYEHGSVTFYVEDVSRSLLVELERHRFLSFSVESQRYVDQAQSHPNPVQPPAFQNSPAAGPYVNLVGHYANSLDYYNEAVSYLLARGYGIKRAREAARAFLPNATPVDLVVTGNLRAWRDVLGKRYHPAADAEIIAFSAEVLRHLRELAPYSVQDFPAVAAYA
ncbi:FAD-dependent thymidylate synthase [Micromonospora andamanensis]|uniref:FAD-dependent thymidylate synthase n=1 Tax=Micromonospora andamanensis TaxID=1287068 RepID=UPI0019504130|nr:FAD-dependent thymidylate synthase [Micromonospora andamanensis]